MFTNHFNKSEFSVACNVDDWSAWGLCSAIVTASGRDCGTQKRTRTREVIQEPNHGGTCFVPVLEERLTCSTEKREGKVFLGQSRRLEDPLAGQSRDAMGNCNCPNSRPCKVSEQILALF